MSPFGLQVRVHSSVVCRLLDRRCGPGSHSETIPCEDAFMSLKGRNSTRLVVQGNWPECVRRIRLEIEVPVMELLDLVGGKRLRTGRWFETLIDERIHRDPVRRGFRCFRRTWIPLGDDHEAR